VSKRPELLNWRQLLRYYQAGIANSVFGYGLYALLVAATLNPYAAQAIAHVAGMVFNWFTYSRHAFAEVQGSRLRFIVSYAVNYLFSLVALKLFTMAGLNPYAAGLISLIIVSLINYFVLARLVFAGPAR
jgi:putative flippase GtrA